MGRKVNDYVLTLFEAMHEVHLEKNDFKEETSRKIEWATLSFPTPEAKLVKTDYGGRITWELEKKLRWCAT